ncbi:MAG: 4-demethylwyosine synthase TYW1, partial [Nanoarchaeota archaeon]|nr:4-demethylwyosine synthase TYW1 [Nanoarchaeota archaeon]
MLTKEQIERLEKQQYRLVGKHSVVKICFWTKECVREKNKVCYKEHFYDVHCGKCLEMSPVITCNQRCLHCWRDTSVFSNEWEGSADEPREIIEGCIEARRKLLIGFKGHDDVDLVKFEDYIIPDHAAISLTGEPCLYPKLPELVDCFFDDFNFRTVFLVTNGTVPSM